MALNSNISNCTTSMNTSDVIDPTELFGPQRDSLYIVLPITIIYIIIFITGLLGNIFTCIVIIQNKNMHTATNFYLFSLAISDLLLLVSGMPQEIYSIWSKWPYIFGNVFCILRGLAAETSTNASILTITLFTIERYIAICHPFVSHQMSELSRALKHILILWTVSLGLALPQALQFGITVNRGVTMCLQTRVIVTYSFEISTLFFFCVPMILITVLYSLIGLRLYRSNVSLHSVEDNQFKRNSIDLLTVHNKKNSTQSTKRVINMLVAVVIAFFICWAPFHAQRLVAIYSTSENHLPKSPILLSVYLFMTYTSGVFYYMSTCINPIVYHIMSNKFRDAFKNTMMLFCCQKTRQPVARRCTYTTVAFSQNTIPLRKKNLKYILNVSSSKDENLCQQRKRTSAAFTKDDGPWSCSHELHGTLPHIQPPAHCIGSNQIWYLPHFSKKKQLESRLKRSPKSFKNVDSDTFNT